MDVIPHYVYYILIFISGTFFGSFLNLVSDRLINGGSIFFGRSQCDFCKKPLGVKNLIPVFSYIVQRGKCSFCKEKLSMYYPISEISSGFFITLAAYISGLISMGRLKNVWDFIFISIIFSVFIIIFLTDLKYYLIPDIVMYVGIISVVLFLIGGYIIEYLNLKNKLSADEFGVYLIKAGYLDNFLKSALEVLGITIISALCIALFFWFLVWITKERGMGAGDIKLGLLIGLFNGFPGNVIAIFLGFMIGAIASVYMILIKKKTMKDTVPFGPFLIIGSLISLLYSPYILNWYINLL